MTSAPHLHVSSYKHNAEFDRAIIYRLYIKKLQAIYLMLYKRWYKTAQYRTSRDVSKTLLSLCDRDKYTRCLCKRVCGVYFTHQLTLIVAMSIVENECPVINENDAVKKPWFLIDPNNTVTEVGQQVSFEAQAAGQPPPSVKWWVFLTSLIVIAVWAQ